MLERAYLEGDLKPGVFEEALLDLMDEQLVWSSDVELTAALSWGEGEGDLAALWKLAVHNGYAGVAWQKVRESTPLRRLFEAAIAQEIREANVAGSPLSLHAAVMQAIALVKSNGVAFPPWGAPIPLPNSDWLSEEALEWLRRRESAAAMRASVAASGGHMSLRSSSMDPTYLEEPLRSEVIGYLKANGRWR